MYFGIPMCAFGISGGGVIGENYECLGAIHPSVVFGGDVLRE
jgi:hypothetical protein